MVVSREEGGKELRIEVEGTEIKMVEKCKYLGGVFGREGGNVQEITSRIAQYGGAVRAVYPILKDRQMSVEMKRVIFEGVLTPILLYGAETWSTTTREDSRIQSAEMYVLRAIMGKTRRDRQRNKRIREEVGVKAILNKMDAARLRWWEHLERMQEGRVAKKRWEWRPEETRPRGRPRKRWESSVEDSLRRHGLPSMQELREDGDWKIEEDSEECWPR